MKSFNKAEWSKIKKQGMMTYLLLNWILAAALPATLILSIFRFVLKGFDFGYFTSGYFIANIIFCTVIAIVCGLRKWRKNNKLYQIPEE